MQLPTTPQIRTLKLYSPHAGQLKMHNSTKRFRIGVFGRQAGKSTWGNNELVRNSWTQRNSVRWFVAPTNAQARVQYRRCKSALFKSPLAVRAKHDTEQRLELLSRSSIFYKSGEVLENLRGETLNEAMIDEVRDQHIDLWPMVIRPMLTTTKGRGSFISTPNGFDAFYELYEYALKHKDDWEVFHSPSTVNPLFTLTEYEAARASMTDRQFRQEILAEFLDLTSGRAYFAFGEDNLSTTSPFKTTLDFEGLIGLHLPVVLGLDFNLNPMSWALGQTNNDQWYWFDEIYLENSNTQEATAELISRLTSLRDRGLLRSDPQLIVCGDAAGKAGQRAAAGQSDYDILLAELRRHGFSYDNQTPDSNPFVKDRIAAVNSRCRTADGSVKLFVHPTRCPRLIRDFRRVVWKDGTAQLDKTKDSSLTHMSDAVGYPIHKLTPVPEVKDVGELVVVQW